FLRRFKSAIGVACNHELLEVLVIDGQALRLEIRGDAQHVSATILKHRPFIPLDPEPLEVFEKAHARGIGGAFLIGVLNSEHELPISSLGIRPAEERGARAANVQMPRRTRSKPRANGPRLISAHALASLSPIPPDVDKLGSRNGAKARRKRIEGW